MKRWFLAAVGLLGLSAVVARADYLMLIINIGDQPKSTTGPSGMGMRGGPMPGAIGAAGAMGMRGGPGAVGMPPGVGAAGMPPGPMGFQGMRGVQGGTPADTKLNYHLVPLCIEVGSNSTTNILKVEQNVGGMINHKWGSALLVKSHGPIALAHIYRQSDNKPYPNVLTRYTREHEKVFKGGKSTTEGVLGLAEWALSHGLLHKFEELMDKLAQDEKANQSVVNYLKMKDALKGTGRLPAAEWFTRKQKDYKTELKAAHYAILHNLPDDATADVAVRATRLEEHLRSFYFWFALHDNQRLLPVPQERQVVVLANTGDELKYFRRGLSSTDPMVVDGFYTPRENATVLSARPLGGDYEMTDRVSSRYWQAGGIPRLSALKGKMPRPTPGTPPPDPYTHVEAGAYALALKAMEEDSEQATIGNDGTRQLLYAAGLLPRNVVVPEWALFGLGRVFGTPPGSPWLTLGAPNLHLLQFRELRRERKLEASDALLIRQVVTDTYFRQAQGSRDPELRKKAEATSWSLSYFLVRKKLPQLQAYFKELGRMPRDLDLDEDVLMGCFARAFDCWDTNKKTFNPTRLTSLANEWIADMNATSLEGEEIFTVMKKAVAETEAQLNKPQGTTAQPNPMGTR